MAPQVRVNVIAHATEDEARIVRSLAEGLCIRPDSLDTRRSEGHYGNTITTISASLRKREARDVLKRLRETLPGADLDHIRETLPSRMGDSTLYVRLDKQEMVAGRVRLSDSGAVRIRITAPSYDGHPEDVHARLLGLD
ncbi:MAG: hypothetical protein J4G04_02555 [Nitrosopumilaceae archaeon]|nr:hypothetical protein [Nitrosopumilaceae archaeon]